MTELSYIDPGVVAAQKKNAERMTDDKLCREWYLVSGFRERPPIREAYLEALRGEFARRGLSEPQDETHFPGETPEVNLP